jgi:hypothetical protein
VWDPEQVQGEGEDFSTGAEMQDTAVQTEAPAVENKALDDTVERYDLKIEFLEYKIESLLARADVCDSAVQTEALSQEVVKKVEAGGEAGFALAAAGGAVGLVKCGDFQSQMGRCGGCRADEHGEEGELAGVQVRQDLGEGGHVGLRGGRGPLFAHCLPGLVVDDDDGMKVRQDRGEGGHVGLQGRRGPLCAHRPLFLVLDDDAGPLSAGELSPQSAVEALNHKTAVINDYVAWFQAALPMEPMSPGTTADFKAEVAWRGRFLPRE